MSYNVISHSHLKGEQKTLLTDADFSGYTVMSSFLTDDSALIALGNSKGVVKVVNTDSQLDILGMCIFKKFSVHYNIAMLAFNYN